MGNHLLPTIESRLQAVNARRSSLFHPSPLRERVRVRGAEHWGRCLVELRNGELPVLLVICHWSFPRESAGMWGRGEAAAPWRLRVADNRQVLNGYEREKSDAP